MWVYWNHQPFLAFGSSIELESPFWTFQTLHTRQSPKMGFHQSWFSFIHVPYQEGPLKQTHRAEHSSGTHLPKNMRSAFSHSACVVRHASALRKSPLSQRGQLASDSGDRNFPDHLGQWIPCISMDGAADFLPWICIGQWQPASETFDESKARSSAGRLAGEVHYRSVAPLGWWMWRLFFKACFVIIVCDCYFSNLDAMILWTCCLKQSSLSWIYEI